MKIIRSLTLSNMRLNPQRTLVTIIGVILSVALITTIPAFVSSFVNMLRVNEIQDGGNWHARFKGIEAERAEFLAEESDAGTWGVSQDIGYAWLEGSKDTMKPYLFVTALDEAALRMYDVSLLEGRLPETPGEVVISEHIAQSGGVTFSVGQELLLELGHRRFLEGQDEGKEPPVLSAGRRPGQEDSIQYGEYGTFNEEIEVEGTRSYRITGVIRRPSFEGYGAPGFTLITAREPGYTGKADLHLTWKTVSKAAVEKADALGREVGAEVQFNHSLLRYFGILSADNLAMLYGMAAVVIALIMMASIAFIFNSFAISISERSRQLGLLASVGATRRQKAASVLFEGFLVAVIGIPLGILLGIGGLGLTFRLIRPLLANLNTSVDRMVLVLSPSLILIAFLISSVTVFLSALLPAIQASRISPVDAIRQTRDVKLTKKSVKTSRLTRRIFGFEAELGLKNLKRNRKRYRITVVSLVVSLVLFIAASAITLYSRKTLDQITAVSRYNVTVSAVSNADRQAKRAFYKNSATLEGVEKSLLTETLFMDAFLDEEEINPELLPEMYFLEEVEAYSVSIDVQSVDETTLDSFARENGVDPESLKDPSQPQGILISRVLLRENNRPRSVEQFKLEAGDVLELHEDYSMEEASITLGIAGTSDFTPLHEEEYNPPDYGQVIVSEEVFDALLGRLPEGFSNSYSELKLESREPDQLVERILEYQGVSGIGQISLVNIEERIRGMKQFNTLISVFFYGFIGLFAAISIANIFNTISTGVNLRRGEFAALKSVGMTPGGFRRMIRFESLFYGIKALVYGLPLSFGLIYLIYRIALQAADMPFELPWTSIFGGVLAVFLLVGLTMSYSAAKLKNQNIIDALKNGNI